MLDPSSNLAANVRQLRLARGLTQGRAAALAGIAVGEVLLGRFNDLEYTADLVRKHHHDLAAVIVEPVQGVGGALEQFSRHRPGQRGERQPGPRAARFAAALD